MNQKYPSVNTGRPQYSAALQGPFYNANNIFMFYGGGDRGQIAESIIQAIRHQEPVVHVHGEVGSGKTMMSLVVTDRIKRQYNTLRYDVPEMSAGRLLNHLLIDLAPEYAGLISPKQIQEGVDEHTLGAALIRVEEQLERARHIQGDKPHILFVDSKEALDADSLRVIERLSISRIDGSPNLHCVVFHTVASNAERYAAVTDIPYQSENHFWLRRLTLAEINEYLRHHMMLFDFNRRDLFTKEMTHFIAEHSDGVFKSINTLARNAFSLANMHESDSPSMTHLLMAGLHCKEEGYKNTQCFSKYRAEAVALLGCCVVACCMAAVFILR